jgi:hypothetical protein
MTSDISPQDGQARGPERLEALGALCERMWTQFNERRKYEVQITLAFWTALVLATAGLMNLEWLRARWEVLPIVAAIAIGAVTLHFHWCRGVWASNRRDRAQALEYQREIERTCAFALSSAATDGRAPPQHHRDDWNFRFQFSVTGFLAASLIATGWLVAAAPGRPDPALRWNYIQDSLVAERTALEVAQLRANTRRQQLQDSIAAAQVPPSRRP